MQDDNPICNPTIHSRSNIGAIIERRLSRRRWLQGSLAASAATAAGLSGCASSATTPDNQSGTFDFAEITRGMDTTLHVPQGYQAQVLLRWGDPLFGDSPSFTPSTQTAKAQARQFGYNCDFVGYIPLPADATASQRGLLCVNHEYTSTALMFPQVAANYPASITAKHCAIEMAAHGGSIVEIALANDTWQVREDSPYNRRVMADNTPMDFTGPAASHPRLATQADPQAKQCRGTLNNCAGGITPWGTYLMAEENFHGYFQGDLQDHPEADNHKRYGVPGGWFQWARFEDDFNLNKEPNGPNRYGWVVEVDAMEPSSTPKKRTALGRFKHEGAENIINP